MKNIFDHKIEYSLLALAFIAGIISAIYFFATDLSIANGDSIARLNISRRVFDSTSPGFSQIGYVWLPINSILMLPFIWIDALYYSGLAGVILSVISYVVAALFVYHVGRILGDDRVGYIAFAFFTLNPNILYMQATSLSEIFYVAVLLGAIYYMLKWAKTYKDVHLITSGAFFFAATLSRYDGWVLALAAAIISGMYLYVTSGNWRKVEATIILFSVVAFFGPLLWFAWNYAIFDHPFYFVIGEYSAKFQQASLLENGLLPSQYDLWSSVQHTFYASQLVLGWSVIILGIFGFVYSMWLLLVHGHLRYLFFVILGLQFLYYVSNLFAGNGVIFVPQLYPHYMHNIRYAVTVVPFFVIAAAIFAARYRLATAVLIGLVIFEYGFMVLSGNIVTLNESLHGFAGRDAHESRIAAGEWLRDNYDEGKLLVDIFDNDSVAFYSKIPLRNWVNVGDPGVFEKALAHPENNVEWVLIRQNDRLFGTFSGGAGLEENFYCVYEYDDVKIYKFEPRNEDKVSLCTSSRLAIGEGAGQ